MLENVEEFAEWGPLVGKPDQLRPCKKRRGKSFRRWVKSLTDLGYVVESRELRACDYGAPTIRKRFYLIARCDGIPIAWPEPTHGDPKSEAVRAKRLKPFRTAAECIDWSIPMLSIFATKEEAKAWGKRHGRSSPVRPLAWKTQSRIARGVQRFVIDNPKPFLVVVAHGEESPNGSKRWGKSAHDIDSPLGTVTQKGNAAVIAPYLVPRYGERAGQEPRSRSVEEPSPVIVPGANGASLVAANLVQYHDDSNADARATVLDRPIQVIDTSNRHGLVATFLGQHNGGYAEGNSADGHGLDEPVSTISTKGPHQSVVAAFLDQANGGFDNRTGREVTEPIATILTQSRGHHGLIAAHMAQSNYGDVPFAAADSPLRTIVAGGTHHAVIASHLQQDFGQSVGSDLNEPARTITGGGGGHQNLVASFLAQFNGTATGQPVDAPLKTVSTVDRFGFVTCSVGGQPFVIDDIAMRMLQPKELYLAQGFRPGYIIDRGHDGRPITKTDQVRMCGNSVSPPVAEAMIRANVPELRVREAKRSA